jgi:hypothetical protein
MMRSNERCSIQLASEDPACRQRSHDIHKVGDRGIITRHQDRVLPIEELFEKADSQNVAHGLIALRSE